MNPSNTNPASGCRFGYFGAFCGESSHIEDVGKRIRPPGSEYGLLKQSGGEYSHQEANPNVRKRIQPFEEETLQAIEREYGKSGELK